MNQTYIVQGEPSDCDVGYDGSLHSISPSFLSSGGMTHGYRYHRAFILDRLLEIEGVAIIQLAENMYLNTPYRPTP